MVRRDVWEKVGGYHTGQRSYGGREPFLTFKMWLFGYRNFTVPTTNHIHYNGSRLYEWRDDWGNIGNDVFYRNCMTQAYSIGGEKWLDIIFNSFTSKKGVKREVISKLREEAISLSMKERSFVLGNQLLSFDDLWRKFDLEGVYY